jgi:hypothetical protein
MGIDHSIAGFSHAFLHPAQRLRRFAPAQELRRVASLRCNRSPSPAAGAEVRIRDRRGDRALGQYETVTAVASLKPFRSGPAKIVATGERSFRSHRHIPCTNLTGETLCGLLREQRTIVKRGRTRPSQSSLLSFCRSRPMSRVLPSAPWRRAAMQAGPIPKVSMSSELESCHARQDLPRHSRRSHDGPRATLAGGSHPSAGRQTRRSSEATRCALMTACTYSFDKDWRRGGSEAS